MVAMVPGEGIARILVAAAGVVAGALFPRSVCLLFRDMWSVRAHLFPFPRLLLVSIRRLVLEGMRLAGKWAGTANSIAGGQKSCTLARGMAHL